MLAMARPVLLAQIFEGCHVGLHTMLDIAECERRLSADFSDAKGRWQHAHSDKQFVGRPWLDGFWIASSRQLYTRNVQLFFLVRLHPTEDGTMVMCSHSAFMRPSAQLPSLLALLIGVACIVPGLYTIPDGWHALLWFLPGIAFPLAALTQNYAPFTEGARHERIAITHYLLDLLDAHQYSSIEDAPPIASLLHPEMEDQPARSGVKIVRRP
jgi:hypothetical protein